MYTHVRTEKDRRRPLPLLLLNLNYKSSLQIYTKIYIYVYMYISAVAGWQADTYQLSNRAYHLYVYHVYPCYVYIYIDQLGLLFVCMQFMFPAKKKSSSVKRRRRRNVLLFAFFICVLSYAQFQFVYLISYLCIVCARHRIEWLMQYNSKQRHTSQNCQVQCMYECTQFLFYGIAMAIFVLFVKRKLAIKLFNNDTIQFLFQNLFIISIVLSLQSMLLLISMNNILTT